MFIFLIKLNNETAMFSIFINKIYFWRIALNLNVLGKEVYPTNKDDFPAER